MSQRAINQFVPFEPVIVEANAPESSFQPKIFPHSHPPPALPPRDQEPSPPPAPAPVLTMVRSQPLVTLQRDGDRVTGIRIECTCGQVIDMECSY